MENRIKYLKTSPIQANKFKVMVENFCLQNKLSECNVMKRKEGYVIFFGKKSYLPILWDFSFEGTFSLHDSYALISIDLSNVFYKFFNYLTIGMALLILLFTSMGISLPDYRAVSPLMMVFWFIIFLLELVSLFLQKRLFNSFCQEIPGSTITIKQKEFSKLLSDL